MTRALKTLHGWLGLIILPWVVLAGFTGLFHNHGFQVLKLLPDQRLTAALVAPLPPHPVTADEVTALAQNLLPAPVLPVSEGLSLSRPAFLVIGNGTTLRVDQATGAYVVIGPYASTLYAQGGGRIATQVQRPKLLNRLHSAGWASDRFGTWPADITATALMIFGLSGLWLFLTPRLRRLKNRWARRA
jgi:hypothetical protein